jgi:sugar phosphate isomerase/epimerase
MKLILFTKFLKGASSPEIAELALRLGFDGLDVAVRSGHCVNPANVLETLPNAFEVWKQAGLDVPLVTLEAKTTDPQNKEVRNIFAACAETGIPFIKLGYWVWTPERHYWDEIENIRRSLDLFQQLGREYGVCSLIHTHSDEYFGSNAAAAMDLVRRFDPRYIGIYLDPAHLALDGEYFPMALDMVRDYLKIVAVKNARPVLVDGFWKTEWCTLDEGLVHWPAIVTQLRTAGYGGYLSVHGEYSASEEKDEVLKLLQHDTAYLKPLLAE